MIPLRNYTSVTDSTKGYITGGSSLESVTVLVGVHYNSVPILGKAADYGIMIAPSVLQSSSAPLDPGVALYKIQ